MTVALTKPHYEHVVLVDESDRPIGTMEKAQVHHAATPLHRGFSVFLFDRWGNVLLQQRSHRKVTWPATWSNACCGHPALHEPTTQAIQRRLWEELGLGNVDISVVLPGYRYRFEHNGIVENEFCPVAVGVVSEALRPNPKEVDAVRWRTWDEFLEEIRDDSSYSEWCVEEAKLLADDRTFRRFHDGLRPKSA